MGLKTTKEAHGVALTYLHAFDNQSIDTINGTFFPAAPLELHQYTQRYLWAAVVMGGVALLLSVQAITVDAIHYWHVDVNVIVGVLVILGFWGVGGWWLRQYLRYTNLLKIALVRPQNYPYGVVITDTYYFERRPTAFHIIPRSNIVRIDYEEIFPNGELYLELLLEWENCYESRGIFYHPDEFDLRQWIEERPEVATIPI